MPKSVLTLPLRGAYQSRYLFTLSSSDDSFKVIAFESAADNLPAPSTDYALDLTLSASHPIRGESLLNDHNYRPPSTALDISRGSASGVAGRGTDYLYGEHQLSDHQPQGPEHRL